MATIAYCIKDEENVKKILLSCKNIHIFTCTYISDTGFDTSFERQKTRKIFFHEVLENGYWVSE